MNIKEKIYNDISESNNIIESDLSEYKFYLEDNINWLYTPLVIRSENESIIACWSYVFNDKNITSSQSYTYSEGKLNDKPAKPFINDSSLMSHYFIAEDIINKKYQMFPDEIFKENFVTILEKYFIELIIQDSGYRIRIRPFMVQEISYDLYFNKAKDELSFNIFNPEL